ncbi:hypothetical protein BDQ12DRAFT_380557 [Crucibulum laeve]|uniref:Uncharacterized protein n=1 Tax=Crucibulum laeve TaxID=68775 RepID=A0A5C3LMD4_9AGAR|nr:hypothetical protein BDQ12DRAFT_380557 [Crucibulum laeve]
MGNVNGGHHIPSGVCSDGRYHLKSRASRPRLNNWLIGWWEGLYFRVAYMYVFHLLYQ